MQNAIDTFNGFTVQNKRIKVAFARPSSADIKNANLYVKNLPVNVTESDVKKLFSQFGTIIQCRIPTTNKGVAFVLYNLHTQAQEAMDAMHGRLVDGSDLPLDVKFASDNVQKVSANSFFQLFFQISIFQISN